MNEKTLTFRDLITLRERMHTAMGIATTNRKRLTFCNVTSIEGPMVTLSSSSDKRSFDLLKGDFPWDDVSVGDKVCMKNGFIHSRVPDGNIIPKEYIESLVRTLK